MSDPVTVIRNIGPAMCQAFDRAGITTADELRSLGAEAAYARLLATGMRPHFIGFYALAMGLQGRPWNDCRGQEKIALRRRFDVLVAQSTPDPDHAIESALDDLGVRVRRD